MHMKMSAIFLAVVFLGVEVQAAPIYKWKDADGTVHYASKPVNAKAQPADLPTIMRGEVKIPKQMLSSCDQHGGINCQAGADKDGSVICYDGFTNAAARYRFSCNSPKLEITEISDPDQEGSFKVYVRNSTSVAASSAAMFFKPLDGKEIKLEGPAEIEPFGLVEFMFRPSGKPLALAKVDIGNLNLTCANCP